MSDLSPLFEPLSLRGVTLRNRVVMTPHGNRLSARGVPTPKLTEYYLARARGGVGLLATQTLAVYPKRADTGARSVILSLWEPESPPAIREMIERIHEHGAKVVAQIGYAGRQFDTGALNRPAYAPSAIPWEPGGLVPRAMSTEEVQRFVGYYAEAAKRAVECGYDMVEIHGAHGYLIHQFLSSLSNQRTDEYGGDLENRARFVREIARDVRNAVGAEVPVGIRLSGDEYVEGGTVIDDVVTVAKWLIADAELDYFSISAGAYRSVERIVPPMYFEQGVHAHLAAAVKAAVGDRAAVTAAGRIYEPEFAAQLISRGDCDLVGMLRALIADPDLPRKASGELALPIRKCVGLCDCWRRGSYQGLAISCAVNPEAGREKPPTADDAKPPQQKVVVVGAGPAGLETAARLARAGHAVTLFEAAADLGGRIGVAARGAGRSSLSLIVEYFAELLRSLPIDVRLSTAATPELIMALEPDRVVLATGGRAIVPGWGNRDGAAYLTRGLLDAEGLGSDVVVYSENQMVAGASVADTLARTGRAVTFVTPHPRIGPALEPNTLHMISRRLADQGVEVMRDTELVDWTPGRATVRQRFAHDRSREIEATNLLYDVGLEPANELAGQLEVAGFAGPVSLVGDCLSPRGIQAAFWDALREVEGLRR